MAVRSHWPDGRFNGWFGNVGIGVGVGVAIGVALGAGVGVALQEKSDGGEQDENDSS